MYAMPNLRVINETIRVAVTQSLIPCSSDLIFAIFRSKRLLKFLHLETARYAKDLHRTRKNWNELF